MLPFYEVACLINDEKNAAIFADKDIDEEEAPITQDDIMPRKGVVIPESTLRELMNDDAG